MNVKTSLKRLLVIVGVPVFLFVCWKAKAMDLYSYDLDSLAYMGEEIVGGRIGKTHELKGLEVTDFYCAAVCKGRFSKGETVKLIALDFFKKPVPGELNTEPMQEGDEVMLFLAKAKETFLYKIPADENIYWPVPSGVKAIFKNKVCGFWQHSNPGPYVLDVEALDQAPSVDRFLRQLQQAIKRTDELATTFKIPPALKDGPWLVELLRKRMEGAERRYRPRDHIAEIACERLAELRDPPLLEQALSIVGEYWHTSLILGGGFGTREGRDYLLTTLGDPKESTEKKLRLAKTIDAAGPIYRSVMKEGGGRIVDPKEASPKNDHYITRIAQLMLKDDCDQELALILTKAIDWFSRGTLESENDLRADLLEAAAVLKKVYDGSRSESFRYAIEEATFHISPDSYRQLKSPCGPILSIMTLANPKEVGPFAKGEIMVRETVLVISKGSYASAVVFQNAKSGEKHLILQTPMHEEQSVGSGHRFNLPKGLPKGRYRIYRQFSKDDRVVSTGHYFEMDL